jgi:hypothetical protein
VHEKQQKHVDSSFISFYLREKAAEAREWGKVVIFREDMIRIASALDKSL